MEDEVRDYSYQGPASPVSPAGRVMGEALDLALEGRSPYPDKSTFIDVDTLATDREVKAAANEGQYAVLVSPDGSTRVLAPEEILRRDDVDAA